MKAHGHSFYRILVLSVCGAALILSHRAFGFTPTGGANAHPSKFPGYVRIGIHNSANTRAQCSAVKIAPRVYLTAGHCLQSPIFSRGGTLRIINLGNRPVKVKSKSLAPTSVRVKDPTTGSKYEQDLAVFTIDRELPELKAVDLSLLVGKTTIQKGDTFRMVGKRDIDQTVYCFADTKNASRDAFCISTRNRPEEGSIRPGDSGGPLYMVRDGKHYLAGITIEYIQEIRSYRDSKGKNVRSTNVIQRFTRLDQGVESRADQWVLSQLGHIRKEGMTSTSVESRTPWGKKPGGLFSGKRKRQVVWRR